MNIEEQLEEIDNDERWDNGELGCDVEYAKVVELTAEEQRAIDVTVGLDILRRLLYSN